MTAVVERLERAGLLPEEARRKAQLFADAETALGALRGVAAAAATRWFVPGRVEVLGKHTDYAGGRSLVCAVGRGMCVVAAPRAEAVLRVADAGRGLTAEVPVEPAFDGAGAGWTLYARAVAARLARDFPGLRGADVAIASDLPRASGLSSSSVLVGALAVALADANRLDERAAWRARLGAPEGLAGYLAAVESGRPFGGFEGDLGVGTRGGGEDPTAIVCCRAGEVAQYAFCPVRHERSMPLEDDWRLVVAASGVAADKTGSAREPFRRLVDAADAVLALWNRSTGRGDATLFSALATGPDAAERLRGLVRAVPVAGFDAASLSARLDHFVEEALALVPEAGDLLARGEPGLLGAPVDRSQELAERLLGNQVPETSFLARSARQIGAVAASAFGGGFGGSVWALVRTDEAGSFRRRWAEGYAAAFPEPARESRFFATRPGPPMSRVPA